MDRKNVVVSLFGTLFLLQPDSAPRRVPNRAPRIIEGMRRARVHFSRARRIVRTVWLKW